MNVLVIGGGGREHALCWALSRSDGISDLFCAPGNAGIEQVARCISLDWQESDRVVGFCRDHKVDLVVIGPEVPLAEGLADKLRDARLRVVGPSAAAAKLESSKVFMREICAEQGIPAPRHAHFDNREEAKSYVKEHFFEDGDVFESDNIVIKADGLAAGKGVVIVRGHREAYQVIDEMFDGKFGEASARILIEEFLVGEEVSLFYLCDGESVQKFGVGRDYKRIGENDTGENTGGMGAYAPVDSLLPNVCELVEKKMVKPALRAMALRGTPFTGFLYAGVMITSGGAKLLEFNVRLGDPETQVVLPRLKSNFLELLWASCSGARGLEGKEPEWDRRSCVTVVMAAEGYPREYKKGDVIQGVKDAASLENVFVFHAGTARNDEAAFLTSGGRVLSVSGLGEDLTEARRCAYEAVECIEWAGSKYRRDIAGKYVKKERSRAPAKTPKNVREPEITSLY